MKNSVLAVAIGLVFGFAFISLSHADGPQPATTGGTAPAAAPAATPAAATAPAANFPNADLVPPDLGPNGPASAPAGKDWPKPTQAQFDAGKQIFQNRCARCHGWNMVNLGSLSFDLRQFPHNDAVRFFHDVRYGKNAMPVWHDILSTEEIADVWAYVRTGGKL